MFMTSEHPWTKISQNGEGAFGRSMHRNLHYQLSAQTISLTNTTLVNKQGPIWEHVLRSHIGLISISKYTKQEWR